MRGSGCGRAGGGAEPADKLCFIIGRHSVQPWNRDARRCVFVDYKKKRDAADVERAGFHNNRGRLGGSYHQSVSRREPAGEAERAAGRICTSDGEKQKRCSENQSGVRN